MATSNRSKVIAKARTQVGYQRKANRWNKYAAEVAPGLQGAAYCGIFVQWCISKALGVNVGTVCNIAYVPSIESWARQHGAWKTSGQKAGDLVVFGFGKSSGQHVGFAWPDPKGSGPRSVEGNTTGGTRGSQANGGGVHVRYRRRSQIRGWVDLDKLIAAAGGSKATSASKPAVTKDGKLVADGRLGTGTVKVLQKRLGVKADGRAGKDTWVALAKAVGGKTDGIMNQQSHKATALGNGVVPKYWSYKGPHSTGDSVVAALQKALGISKDGVWFEGTTKALQKKLNADPKWLTR
jgi:hypothetical protein